jgi:hypothetical protein
MFWPRVIGMIHSADYYARLSEEEMFAAKCSAESAERLLHVEKAYRLARIACLKRKTGTNVIALRP